MQVTNDGHRFRFESLNHDQPKGSLHWDQSFIDLIDTPGYAPDGSSKYMSYMSC